MVTRVRLKLCEVGTLVGRGVDARVRKKTSFGWGGEFSQSGVGGSGCKYRSNAVGIAQVN